MTAYLQQPIPLPEPPVQPHQMSQPLHYQSSPVNPIPPFPSIPPPLKLGVSLPNHRHTRV